MKKIPVWIERHPQKSWFSIYSHILSPDDEDLREEFFTYLYCNWIISSDNEELFAKKNFNSTRVITSLTAGLDRDDFTKEFLARREKVRITGILLRLMYSIHHAGEKASLQKAVTLYRREFSKRNRLDDRKFNISETFIESCYKQFVDVIHLCAARKAVNIDDFLYEDGFKDRLLLLLSISKRYKEFASNFQRSSHDERHGKNLIDPRKIFDVSYETKDPKCTDIDLCYDLDKVGLALTKYKHSERDNLFVE